jgi:hypothetical protein
MTNEQIRVWYQREVSTIAGLNLKWIEQGHPLEHRARRAFEIRHGARLQARAMMENPTEAEQLRARDLQLYGNPDGPTFDQLVEAHRQTGCSGDEVYERIIQGAQTTNAEVDERLRSKGRKP